MKQFIENLPDGWTIYVWMVMAAVILIAAVYALRWASRNDQFDEDIKYVVFTKDDEEKMEPEEFAKSRAVVEQQQKLRQEYLQKKAKAHVEKPAGR